jgi:PAS domain S-box-containing protein
MTTRFQLSIRTTLLLTISALTLIIALVLAKTVYENWEKLERLRGLKEATILSDQLFDTTELYAVERDIAVSMLRAADRDTIAELRPRLESARREADNSLHSTLSFIDKFRFEEVTALRQNTLARLRGIHEFRTLIDLDLALAHDRRDPTLSDRWSQEVSLLLSQTQELWNGFIRHFTNIDAIATQHLRLKHFLRRLIEYTGSERSTIGQLIAENAPPTTAQFSELLQARGAAKLSWQFSRLLADQSNLYPLIAGAYTDAASHYATMHDMVEDVFYKPGFKHNGPYPISADLWFELSTQASESLTALRDAATRESRAYTQKLIDQSEQAIGLQLIVFVLALGLCGFSYWVIAARVMKPIRGIVDALIRATRGEEIGMTPLTSRRDEIGKLGEVLHAFHRTTLEVKRASDARDRSQSELNAVVTHAVDGLITTDATGAIRTINPAGERLFGYSAEEIVGRSIATLLPESGGDDGPHFARFFGAPDASLGNSHEISARHKDGSTFPIELSISAFTLGDAQHFSGIVRDITRRKEAEQELVDHARALERSNKELDDFAYIASHDLKEPLRGIHNHARFLLEDNAEKLDQDSTGRLNRLVYLSQRMERLVNDLLYFSRLGRQELAIQETDLGEAIADVASTLDMFLEERGAKIVIPVPLPTIVCDKPRVTELFRNLITNAVKYNDKANKIVEIGFLAKHHTEDGTPIRNVLYVKDDGRGIAPEFHQEIFRIFKRLQSSKEGEEGTGVGLTFVKKIVERHGGKIWLESQPGQGTTFLFTLESQHHEHDARAQAA